MWLKLTAGLVAVALLALVLFGMGRAFLGVLNAIHADGGRTEPDPMFREEPERVTRPPELDENGQPVAIAEDPSLGWVYEEQSPVEKTAEELSREAAAGL